MKLTRLKIVTLVMFGILGYLGCSRDKGMLKLDLFCLNTCFLDGKTSKPPFKPYNIDWEEIHR